MKDDFMEMLKVRADDGSCIYGYINYAGEAYDRLIEAQSRIEALEAALRSIAANTCCEKCQEASLVARAALAGEKKDG